MKDKNIFFSVFLCALCVLCGERFSHAAETRTFTLDQALAIADQRNRDIQKAREYYNQVHGRYVEERAAGLPQLTIMASASRDRDESLKALSGLSPSSQDHLKGEIAISQPVFTWGQVSAAIRAARFGLMTADDQLRLFRQAARREVTTVFYDILLARELNAIARQNLEQKERHLEEAKRKLSAGVATDYDFLAAGVAVDNAKPDVIRTGNQVRVAKDRLRFLLALEDEVDVMGSLEVTPMHPLTFEESFAVAREKRPELSDLRHRIAASDELVRVVNAGDKPRIDLQGGYGWRMLETVGSRGDGAAWNAGVFLTFPLFDGLRTRGKVSQARSEVQSLRIDEAKILDSIALEARTAVNAVQEAGEIAKALAGTVTQAERLLFMAEKGYEFGVKIRLEVEDAELNLQQARGNLARARRDYLVALVNMEWAKGVLGE